MKLSELRIGNFVMCKGELTIFEIGEWYSGDTVSYRISFTLHEPKGAEAGFTGDRLINQPDIMELIEPIPLTEEWLLKFGIKSGINGTTEELSKVTQAIISKNFDNSGYTLYSGHNCLHVPIKYVHQLQNIYFALTRKELQLKKDINGK